MIRKIEYKSKLNKMSNNNKESVQEIMKSSENNNINAVISNDLDKQKDDFKKKLTEKRRKSALSEIGDSSSVNYMVK